MVDTLNVIAALLTIAFGAFGFLAPRFTAGALDLEPKGSNMGLSELRASVGGLFVVLGAAALWTGSDAVYASLGIAYVGAAAGRLLSILLDKPPLAKAGLYFAIEALLAAWLVAANSIPL